MKYIYIIIAILYTGMLISNYNENYSYNDNDNVYVYDNTSIIKLLKTDISIDKEGVLNITETITVNSDFVKSRLGFLRRLNFFHYDTSLKTYFRHKYNIKSVTYDGVDEPFSIFENNNDIYIKTDPKDSKSGDRGKYNHTYVIKYQSFNNILFLKNHNALYYNVTDNWDSYIEIAEATVSVYNGAYIKGYQLHDTRSFVESDCSNSITFSHISQNRKRDNFIVNVEFSKGITNTNPHKNELSLFNNYYLISGFIACLISFLYYFIAWKKYGEDNDLGTIFPYHKLKHKISIATACHLLEITDKEKIIPATIFDLVNRGILKITESSADVFQIKLIKKPYLANTSKHETTLLEDLFVLKNTIDIGKNIDSSYYIFNVFNAYCDNILKEKNKFIRNNTPIVKTGQIITVAILFLTMGLSSLIFIIPSVCLYIAVTKMPLKKKIPFIGIILLFSYSFQSYLFVNAIWAGFSFNIIIFFLICICLVYLYIIFEKIMKKPTCDGDILIKELKGLELFLKTLGDSQNKHITEDIKELLPFSILFDLNLPWQERLIINSENLETNYQFLFLEVFLGLLKSPKTSDNTRI